MDRREHFGALRSASDSLGPNSLHPEMVLTAEPGTPSDERLRILASWNAEPRTGMGAGRPSAEETDA